VLTVGIELALMSIPIPIRVNPCAAGGVHGLREGESILTFRADALHPVTLRHSRSVRQALEAVPCRTRARARETSPRGDPLYPVESIIIVSDRTIPAQSYARRSDKFYREVQSSFSRKVVQETASSILMVSQLTAEDRSLLVSRLGPPLR
jgi:hypothetical protein